MSASINQSQQQSADGPSSEVNNLSGSSNSNSNANSNSNPNSNSNSNSNANPMSTNPFQQGADSPQLKSILKNTSQNNNTYLAWIIIIIINNQVGFKIFFCSCCNCFSFGIYNTDSNRRVWDPKPNDDHKQSHASVLLHVNCECLVIVL